MSRVQLLRAIFHALADPRTFSQGIFMQWSELQGNQKATAPSQQAMQKAFEVVFVDSSGWCNLAAHVSKSALKQVSCSWTVVHFQTSIKSTILKRGTLDKPSVASSIQHETGSLYDRLAAQKNATRRCMTSDLYQLTSATRQHKHH